MSNSDEQPATNTYNGSCHCQLVKYTVQSPALEDISAIECNCSICLRNGYLFIYRPNADVKFEEGSEAAFKAYKFGKERIAHYFCNTCGTSVYAESIDPEFYPGYKAINVRTIEDVDLTALKRVPHDGKSD